MGWFIQKKKADENRRLSLLSECHGYSDWPHILRPWSFGTASGGVGHLLTFLKVVVVDTFKVGVVEENVFTGSGVDEAKSSVCQSLNCAFCHLVSDLKKFWCGTARHDWSGLNKPRVNSNPDQKKKTRFWGQSCGQSVVNGDAGNPSLL